LKPSNGSVGVEFQLVEAVRCDPEPMSEVTAEEQAAT
jgi:hypothetical protein